MVADKINGQHGVGHGGRYEVNMVADKKETANMELDMVADMKFIYYTLQCVFYTDETAAVCYG